MTVLPNILCLLHLFFIRWLRTKLALFVRQLIFVKTIQRLHFKYYKTHQSQQIYYLLEEIYKLKLIEYYEFEMYGDLTYFFHSLNKKFKISFNYWTDWTDWE